MQITANATQSDGWWAIEVPELGFMTQAKRLTEIEDMARSLAVDVLEIEPDAVQVTLNVVLPDETADAVNEAREQMREAQEHLAAASKASFDAVNALRNNAGLTVREVAKLMQISAGRVTQIEHKSSEAISSSIIDVALNSSVHVLTAAESKRTDFALAH